MEEKRGQTDVGMWKKGSSTEEDGTPPFPPSPSPVDMSFFNGEARGKGKGGGARQTPFSQTHIFPEIFSSGKYSGMGTLHSLLFFGWGSGPIIARFLSLSLPPLSPSPIGRRRLPTA